MFSGFHDANVNFNMSENFPLLDNRNFSSELFTKSHFLQSCSYDFNENFLSLYTFKVVPVCVSHQNLVLEEPYIRFLEDFSEILKLEVEKPCENGPKLSHDLK